MSLNRPPVTPWFAHSSTITAGGTAQQLMAANNNRVGVLIENLHASEAMWVKPKSANGTDAAASTAGNLQIAAGQRLFIADYADPGIWSIVAATTGHPFTAFDWGE